MFSMISHILKSDWEVLEKRDRDVSDCKLSLMRKRTIDYTEIKPHFNSSIPTMIEQLYLWCPIKVMIEHRQRFVFLLFHPFHPHLFFFLSPIISNLILSLDISISQAFPPAFPKPAVAPSRRWLWSTEANWASRARRAATTRRDAQGVTQHISGLPVGLMVTSDLTGCYGKT